MSKKSIDDLIGNLTQDLKPVKPMPCPVMRILPWIIATSVYVFILVYLTGVRHDAIAALGKPVFLFEIGLMAYIAISAAIASSFLSVPDMKGQQWVLTSSLTAFGVFMGWTVIRMFTEGFQTPQMHMDHCMGEGVFMAIIPVAALIFYMKRGCTTRPVMTAFMNVLAITGIGYIGLRFTCSMDVVEHATITHLLPYVVLGTLCGVLARRVYKW
ncbi:MAG: NrsF family protein [Bdellovibrionales bacterium]